MSRMAGLVATMKSKSCLLTNAPRDATLSCHALYINARDRYLRGNSVYHGNKRTWKIGISEILQELAMIFACCNVKLVMAAAIVYLTKKIRHLVV